MTAVKPPKEGAAQNDASKLPQLKGLGIVDVDQAVYDEYLENQARPLSPVEARALHRLDERRNAARKIIRNVERGSVTRGSLAHTVAQGFLELDRAQAEVHAKALLAVHKRMLAEEALREIIWKCEHDACGMNGRECHACRMAWQVVEATGPTKFDELIKPIAGGRSTVAASKQECARLQALLDAAVMYGRHSKG